MATPISDTLAIIHALEDHLKEFRRPFDWEGRACAIFAAAWVKKRTGRDVLANWPKWQSSSQAGDALASMGFENLKAAVDSYLPRRELSRAVVGDIVGRGDGEGFSLGICSGQHSWFLGPNGPGKLRTMKCSFAWAVS